MAAAALHFHVDFDDDNDDAAATAADTWCCSSSSASSLAEEVEAGFTRQLEALARLDGGGATTNQEEKGDGEEHEEGDGEGEESSALALLERLPHGDRRRRWILTSLRLHAAQLAARRRRLLCLGQSVTRVCGGCVASIASID